MAVAAWLVKSIADPGRERQWVRARALAEAAKSEAYRYVAALPPYDAADPGAQLLGRMQDLITKNDDVPAVEVSEDEAARGVPAQPMSAADYAQSRAEEQELKFFRPSAAKNERLASRYALLTQGLTGLAAVLGALGAIYTAYGIEAWVATLGTIATAIGAYALGQRYQRLAATYQVTADRLGLRRAAWALASAKGPSADIDRAFVADIEAILAAENQSWMADRIK
jgi:hypothetical protein